MDYVLENCSSPGASFTDNTNNVLLSIYDWIKENGQPSLSFRSFRTNIQNDKHINDNNARNIYPLVKNCGMIDYEKGDDLDTGRFFTNTGLAYVKALETKRLIESSDYSNNVKSESLKKITEILHQLVYGGLKQLLMKETNYKIPLENFIKYLKAYEKINRYEFSYLLYKNQNGVYDLDELKEVVDDYRNGLLELNPKISVRNDIDIRNVTSQNRRQEGIGFLSSFNYFACLLYQAGLVVKDGEYYICRQNKKQLLDKLVEEL